MPEPYLLVQGQVVSDADIEGDRHSAPHESDEASAPLLPVVIPSEDKQDGTPPSDMDKGWATAFKINVFVTLVAAVCFGSMAAEAVTSDLMSGAGRRRLQLREDSDESDDEEGGHALGKLLLGGAIMFGAAGLVAAGMLHSLVHCSRGIISASFGLLITVICVDVILLFSGNFFVIAIAIILAAAFTNYVVRTKMHRMLFGASNLKVATLALKSMPWTIRSALLMSAVQFLWSLVAGVAALGSFVAYETVTASDGTSHRAIYCISGDFDNSSPGASCMCNGEKVSDGECEFSGLGRPLMFLWLVSMGWGCRVIKNVVACTVTGSVASWWFTPNEDFAPVKGAFHRATHASFGSLCKAAVVGQVMAILSALARRVLRFVPCASYLLSWAQNAVRYVLAYTVCFIGVYGLSFNEAGSHVRELFQRRAVTTLANDVIVDIALFMLTFAALMVYAGVSVAMFGVTHNFELGGGGIDSMEFWSYVGPQVFGWVSLMLLVSTVLEVVRSGFKAVFVCFVQDPEALAQNHGPELHGELSTAWEKMQAQSGPVAVVGRPAPPLTRVV